MMSAIDVTSSPVGRRQIALDTLREETGSWLFVVKALLAFFITCWIAMRLALPQPSTAMLTTVIVANRQSGMVLAKSFYRGLGTLAGAVAGVVVVSLFPQQGELFLVAMALWVGLCAGGATLYRNFKSYAFVLAGYTAAIVALPAIDNPPGVFDSAVARISEVLLGLLVTGAISDTVFPVRMRDVLRRTAREQFAHFITFMQRSTGGSLPREAMEAAHLRFVRDAVTLEDLRSSVVFEDAEARARSGHMSLLNQRFMAASTSFQSLHHLINRLQRGGRTAARDALIALYRPIGEALDAPIEAGAKARVLCPRLAASRKRMAGLSAELRAGLADPQDLRDFDTGAALLERFAEELYEYVDAAASLQAPQLTARSAERVRFARGNDYFGAGLAMLRTVLTMLALGAFWIASAWPLGLNAMLLATVFAGLFATVPNPKQQSSAIMFGYLTGMSMGFVCEFFVLTQFDGYPLLVAGVAPFMATCLWLMTRPKVATYGLGCTMGLAYILALRNPMVYDPVHFINDAIAQIVGLGASIAAFVVVPPAIGSGWLRRRQLARLRSQVALAAEAPLPGLRARFESINHDLFSQIVAHTAPGTDDSRALIAWTLAVHETGRALIELRHDLAAHALPENADHFVDAAIGALARFYERPDSARYLLARDTVATAIAAVSDEPRAGHVLDHLHLLRMAILDGESVLADYMPVSAAAREIAHAP
jgi:uncharacterized membrane protein YccC